MSPVDRRVILKALTAAVGMLAARPLTAVGAVPSEALSGEWTVQTLEAFADTMIPGKRRFPGDLAIAGVVNGPGAVHAGAMHVLTSPELPIAPVLPEVAALLNARAVVYAASHLILLPVISPAFVGLAFRHRTALTIELFDTDDLDRPIWQVLGLLVGMAFDTAAHLDTRQAVMAKHPGLDWLRFPLPDSDGLWRFRDYSYGRTLAALHPATTPSGSPT
ncbi:DUF5987 family protein [Streptomyces virginiae]|uniref:DUF5987 family protein n=1 Tax=Streptomyces virginiae TaxID=1961 RepID=UPI003683A568